MKKLIRKFWKDENGFIISIELVLIATILVIGLVAGMTQLRDSVASELADVATAVGSLDQSLNFDGLSYAGGSDAAGSNATLFSDAPDGGDELASSGAQLGGPGAGMSVSTTSLEGTGS